MKEALPTVNQVTGTVTSKVIWSSGYYDKAAMVRSGFSCSRASCSSRHRLLHRAENVDITVV